MFIKFLIFALVGLPTYLFIHYFVTSYSLICSNEKIAKEILPELCKNRSHDQIFRFEDYADHGDLCNFLCKNPDAIDISCMTHHLNKDVVFVVSTSTQKLVVKSVSDDEEDAYWNQESEQSSYLPTESDFNTMVATHISYTLGNHVPKSPVNTYLYRDANKGLTAHKEFWQLVNHQEFLISYMFESMKIFPKVYGTCGRYYAVQYANPLIEEYDKQSSKIRLLRSIELVKFISKLGDILGETLHLCDVKTEHFGRLNNILYLDLDSVETDSTLRKIFNNTEECSLDDDCSYFDCQSQCLPSNTCLAKRLNTNLQVLCGKILLGISDANFMSNDGLLSTLDISDLSKEALHLCSTNPGMTADVLIGVLKTEAERFDVYHHEL